MVFTQSSLPFNLNYSIDKNLEDVPEEPNSMKRYIAFLESRLQIIRRQNSKSSKNSFFRAHIKFLGELGSYYRIMGQPSFAEVALNESLALIEALGLGPELWMVHTLRLAEVFQLKKDFLSAETALASILEMIRRHPNLEELKHFCFHQFGKLYFQKQELKQAKEYLEAAIMIRSKMKIPELIKNSENILKLIEVQMIKNGLIKMPNPVGTSLQSKINKYKKS